MVCTRCEGTGFLNLHQIDEDNVLDDGVDAILMWIQTHDNHDVMICDCCGGEEGWYGEPGYHHHNGSGWDTPGIPDCI